MALGCGGSPYIANLGGVEASKWIKNTGFDTVKSTELMIRREFSRIYKLSVQVRPFVLRCESFLHSDIYSEGVYSSGWKYFPVPQDLYEQISDHEENV